MIKIPLILASASPRRRKILDSLGIIYTPVIPAVDEVFYLDQPQRTAEENAMRKNNWCRMTNLSGNTTSSKNPISVLSADTVIDFKGKIVTKPSSLQEAAAFLKAFSGTTHKVLTAVVLSTTGLSTRTQTVISEVSFRMLTNAQINEYLANIDPMDKAGAYDIDQNGSMIIESFAGSKTNIMGLPSELISEWIMKTP
ncbi:MAG: septum formation protein Maf [Lentisphaerae bacterium]|nr:septum formation protein Maf [Lentisphaerota bacterium]